MNRRSFTVDEANAMIPYLEEVVRELERKKADARRIRDRLEIFDVMWGDKVEEASNPDNSEYAALRRDAKCILDEIQEIVETRVLAKGIRFPVGGLEHGLMDFPTTYDGRWVLLCWQYGEDEVGFWHEIDAGFQGRQALTPVQRRAMGRNEGA